MTDSSIPPGGPPPPHPGRHDPEELGALALGVLDPDRARAVEAHLASCASCRRDLEDLTAVTDLLGEVPPEALLDGPPDDDLVLRRTLRQMRSETAARHRRRRLPRLLGAAAAVVALLAGGVAIGRATAPDPVVITAAGPQADDAVVLRGEGVRGVSMTAVVSPAAGWVRVSTNVRGIRAGERCDVVVLTRDGRREVAASWLTSKRGEREGTQVDGAAIVAPDDVAGVAVLNDAGEEFVVLRA